MIKESNSDKEELGRMHINKINDDLTRNMLIDDYRFREPSSVQDSDGIFCTERLCTFNKRVARLHNLYEIALTWKSLA